MLQASTGERGVVRTLSLSLTALIACLLSISANAFTYYLTPDGPSLSSFVDTLQPGDVVEVLPGIYKDIVRISVSGTEDNPIVIRGVGDSRPVFDAAGLAVTGVSSTPRAVFQIEGANIQIDNVELTNGRNGSGNGAGVRLLNSTNAKISNVSIHHNDMGVVGNDTHRVVIQGSDIGYNGTSTNGMNGYSHNVYMDGAGDVVMIGNHIHDATHGQNFKSRAHYNELWYNWIADSNEGEIGPVQGAYTAQENSNFLMVGNTVISSADRSGNHVKYINFGQDGTEYDRNGTAYLFNNTFVAGSSSNAFLWLSNLSGTSDLSLVSENNLFFRSDQIVYPATPEGAVTGSNNWVSTGSSIAPGVFAGSIVGDDPLFVDPENLDFQLLLASMAVDQGLADMVYYDGDGLMHSVDVVYSYLLGQGLVQRPSDGLLDIGAYEVPEPTTLSLLLIGIVAIACRREWPWTRRGA